VKLRKVYSKDNDLNRVQDNVSGVLDFIQQSPLTGAVTVVAAPLTIGANSVGHRLGRRPIGWFTIGTDAPCTLYDTAPADQTFLYITSDIAANVTLIVI